MFCKIMCRLRGAVSHKQYQVYATSETPEEFVKNPDYSLVKLNREDLENMPMCAENERLPKFIRRLAEGHDCYGHKARETKEICSYFWVSDARAVDCAVLAFDFDLCLPEDGVYIFDCRVAEEHRGKKLYTDGLLEIMVMYRGSQFLITAETENVISQKGILNAGYQYIGTVDFVKLLHFSFACCRGFKDRTITMKKRRVL